MNIYGSVIGKQNPDQDLHDDPSPRLAYEKGDVHQADEQSGLLSDESSGAESKVAAVLSGLKGRVGSTGFAAVALCALVAILGSSGSLKSLTEDEIMNTMPVGEIFEMQQNAFTLAESDYRLEAFGEGGGSCPNGKAVSQDECYEAAKAVGGDFTFENDSLNVGTWSFLPCGCFIYDTGATKWIDYKDPSAGNCVAPKKAALVCKSNDPVVPDNADNAAELYAKGEGNGKCTDNKDISKDQCLATATKLGKEAGMTGLKDTLNVGTWNFTPCGCFIYDAGVDKWIDYKDPAAGNCKPDPNSQLICLEEEPMPVSPGGDSDFDLLEPGADGACPDGLAVSKEECFEAAHEVGGNAGLTNLKDFLNVGTWPFTPCGCFIYLDEWVDYKDPAAGNCKPDKDSKLICRKPKETPSPTPEPTPDPTASPTPEPTPDPTASPTPEPTAEPTPSPTIKPTKSPTQINHPCGTDSCCHTCVIRPGEFMSGSYSNELLLK